MHTTCAPNQQGDKKILISRHLYGKGDAFTAEAKVDRLGGEILCVWLIDSLSLKGVFTKLIKISSLPFLFYFEKHGSKYFMERCKIFHTLYGHDYKSDYIRLTLRYSRLTTS